MTASFPTTIKAFTRQVDGISTIDAADVNEAYDEIEALENNVVIDSGNAHLPGEVVTWQTGKLVGSSNISLLSLVSTTLYISGAQGGTTELHGNGTLELDGFTATVPATGTLATFVTVPNSAISSGVVGDIACDATHLYVCVAPNVWVRALLATW